MQVRTSSSLDIFLTKEGEVVMQNLSHLSVFLILALLNLSCGDDNVMNTSGGEEGLRINEVLYSTANDQIELKNFGSESVDVSTWWFCSLFAYAPISNLNIVSGSLNIPPGGILAVSGFNLSNTSADLGLYETNNFTSSGAMHDFVQWGSAANGRESVAVGKGIWTAGDFTSIAVAGHSIEFDGEGRSSSDWANQANPTIGAQNTSAQSQGTGSGY